MSADVRAQGGAAGAVKRGRVSSGTVLGIASFGAFLAFLDATIVNVAFPSIRESFPDATISNLSWVLNAYNIVFAAFLVPFGRMSDLIGRRRAFASGVLVFTVASVICALSPSVGFLVAARVVQALGAAMLVPASLALVVAAFPAERRTHAVGLWGASAALAAGLGPPIGGLLVEFGDWRWAFLVNLPFGIAAWVIARRSLVESRAPGRRTLPDLGGAALFALALGLLTLGIVQGGEWGWTSWPIIGCFVVSTGLLVLFVFSSRRHRSPLLDPELLKVRAFKVGNVATVAAGMGFYAYLLTNILWLTYVWGYSVLRAGMALVPAALIAAVVAAVLGPIAAKRGYRLFIVPGALIWAGGYVWYATQVGTTPAFLAEWLPGQVLSGLGVGMALPLLGSATLAAVPGGRYATASAVASATRQMGGVLGIALLVVIIGTPTPATSVDSFRQGWWMSVACFVVVAVIAVFLGRIQPAPEEPDDPSATRIEVHLPPVDAAPAQAAHSIGTVPLFSRLPEPVRVALDATARERHLEAGTWLFRAGDEAGAVYVLRAGRLEVVIGDEVVRELGPGSVVGELALLTAGTRSASIRARRDSILSEVSRAEFDAAMSHDPGAYPALAAVLAEQLADARPPARAVGTRPVVVSVIGMHPGAPVDAVVAALRAQLRTRLRTDVLAEPTPGALERAEGALDRVLLVAAADDRNRDFCLRQADQVVLVAAASQAPGEAGGVGPGADLVLVGSRPPEETVRRWCQALDPWHVTVVPEGAPRDDLRMLAARIGGWSVGMIMAGGGARGFAHIGVLQELAAAGIHIDRVAGSSIGSIVAGAYATGLDTTTLHEVHYEDFVRSNPIGDYTFPSVSLIKGRRTRSMLRHRLGGQEIQALPRPFRCMSVDLLGRGPVEHRSGDLAEAISASVSIPVLFPPMRHENRLLVDGGVLDNLPVRLLTERDEGPILAVNIAMGGGGGGKARTGPPRMPSMGDTLLRVMMIGSGGAVQSARDLGATVVTPPPLGVGTLEWHQMDVVVEAGRMAARELLEQTGGVIPGHTTQVIEDR
ncbi:MAG: DHA2 family efflux MFS transporter permease subunit [Candidatus Nanopelagicales bacterium]|jgi:EmrB/QacA subfamily drug resistance transporter|nr:DHA2 family efflux MFS transporter permease subunit [Candidatus Nanopelagicales bacterium]